ncbi:hypothetical protein JOL62DRAFT_31489 [Phyllosticta paracitricarpa]|uniref:Uncharacterized protein n=1 Tax=Phyllosticta paracitricarpa TaxID=2016321 RepID=A0ABR1NDE7_9PEZI
MRKWCTCSLSPQYLSPGAEQARPRPRPRPRPFYNLNSSPSTLTSLGYILYSLSIPSLKVGRSIFVSASASASDCSPTQAHPQHHPLISDSQLPNPAIRGASLQSLAMTRRRLSTTLKAIHPATRYAKSPPPALSAPHVYLSDMSSLGPAADSASKKTYSPSA